MREWGSSGGTRRDFMVGCPLPAASVLFCTVQADRWISPHLAVRTLLIFTVGLVSLSRFDFLLSGMFLGCLLLKRVGVLVC